MARTQPQEPTLSQGNRIYLYALLARELGCGKQTFLPRVEEALATDRMTADDLGFETTRALLEAMGDCVNLTVFKGGRIYATVIAQPAWDEALATSAESKADAAAKDSKPWKRKKADKSLKPIRPRRVKREMATPVIEPAAEPKTELAAEPEHVAEPEPTPEPVKQDVAPEAATEAVETVESDKIVEVTELAEQAEAKPEPEAEPEPESAQVAEPIEATEPEPEPEPMAQEPQPSITLTITYDPYSDSDEETTLEASREALVETTPQATVPVETEPIVAQATAGVSTPAPAAPAPSPEALAGYPRDFAREVYCPAEHLTELNRLLPLGTAPMPLLAEDFQRALNLELISGTRSRATFPLRVQHLESADPIAITIRKQSGPGLPWAILRVS